MDDLGSVLRSTGAVREFTDDPVDDDVVYRILEAARFAPNGGNRQSWRVVLVRETKTRRRLRDLYLPGWYEYLAQRQAGLVPFSWLNDPLAEQAARRNVDEIAARAAATGGGFAEHLDRVPVLLAVFADLGELATVDRDLERVGLIGGASVYPFCWSILLAARREGLGGVITTMAVRAEDEVRRLFGAPATDALAAVVALGHPARAPRRLTRRAVEEFATLDHVDGPPLRPPGT